MEILKTWQQEYGLHTGGFDVLYRSSDFINSGRQPEDIIGLYALRAQAMPNLGGKTDVQLVNDVYLRDPTSIKSHFEFGYGYDRTRSILRGPRDFKQARTREEDRAIKKAGAISLSQDRSILAALVVAPSLDYHQFHTASSLFVSKFVSAAILAPEITTGKLDEEHLINSEAGLTDKASQIVARRVVEAMTNSRQLRTYMKKLKQASLKQGRVTNEADHSA